MSGSAISIPGQPFPNIVNVNRNCIYRLFNRGPGNVRVRYGVGGAGGAAGGPNVLLAPGRSIDVEATYIDFGEENNPPVPCVLEYELVAQP